MDGTLLTPLPSVLEMMPDSLDAFDQMVYTQVEEQLDKTIVARTETTSNGDLEKVERAIKVAEGTCASEATKGAEGDKSY